MIIPVGEHCCVLNCPSCVKFCVSLVVVLAVVGATVLVLVVLIFVHHKKVTGRIEREYDYMYAIKNASTAIHLVYWPC